jgi:hypothetical protein
MKQIKIIDQTGKNVDAFVPESAEDLQKQISDNKKQNLKEHLYMGYLIIGTIAFTLGILISLKRLNGGE